MYTDREAAAHEAAMSADIDRINSSAIATREEWMTFMAAKYLWPTLSVCYTQLHEDSPDFKPFERPKVRISVGFPKASGGRGKAIGQCWSSECSQDGTFEVFVSPELEPFDVCHVLLHELVHAVVGIKAGHKKPFRDLARAVGLTGKMTGTVPGDALAADINRWLTELPNFPHAPLRPIKDPTKQSTRLIKVECSDSVPNAEGDGLLGCGYTMRVTAKWLKAGAPRCPNPECECYEMTMNFELPEDDEAEGE